MSENLIDKTKEMLVEHYTKHYKKTLLGDTSMTVSEAQKYIQEVELVLTEKCENNTSENMLNACRTCIDNLQDIVRALEFFNSHHYKKVSQVYDEPQGQNFLIEIMVASQIILLINKDK